MLTVLAILAGGSIGASLSLGGLLIDQRMGGPILPVGVLAVNVTGVLPVFRGIPVCKKISRVLH